MKINEKTRIIRKDAHCLELQELRQVKNSAGEIKDRWAFVGYYGHVESALLGALDKRLFDSVKNQSDIEQMFEEIKEAKAEILAAAETWQARKNKQR